MIELRRPAFMEGKDPPVGQELDIWQSLIGSGKRNLASTKVVLGGGPFGEEEINGIDRFISEAAQINPEVFNPSTQEHLQLAGRYARLFATILQARGVDIDPAKAEALGKVHDLGRMFTHRKGRNEVIETALMKKIGFSSDFRKDLYPDTIFAPLGLEKMTPKKVAGKITSSVTDIVSNPYWAVVLTADLLAKKKDGRLRRWEDVTVQGHFFKKYEESPEMWPSEKRRWVGGKMKGGEQAINYQYTHMGRWMEKMLGVSLDEVVEHMEMSQI